MSADANKKMVRRLVVEPWEGNLGVIDELVASNYVGHDPAQPDMQGPEGIKEFITGYLAGYPDGKITIDEQLAEGDLVATRWTGRGTHQGELMGIPPTGKKIEITGYGTYYFENGQITWDTIVFDGLDALEQLGVNTWQASVPPAAA